MEIRRLKAYGLISDYWQYDQLPLPVLDDARLMMAAEDDAHEQMKDRA